MSSSFPASGQVAPAAPAAPTGNVNDTLKAAFEAFNRGDFENAAVSLDSVIQNAADSPQLEPVYYMLGSAQFNMGDYAKAIETFTKYQKKFPKSERTVNVEFSLGQAYLVTKQYAQAADVFKDLDRISPLYHLESRLFAADALKDEGNIDEAITMLEPLVAGGIQTPIAAKAALMLAPFYADKGEPEKAVALVAELGKKIGLVENIVQFNSVAIKLGDKFLDKKKYEDALTCYRLVQLKEEVIRLQNARIEAKQFELARNLAAVRANPALGVQMVPANTRVRGEIADGQALLADFQKVPPYIPTLDLRIGRAFYELGKKWEAIVAYGDVLRKYPDSKEAEPSLFGTLVSFVDLQRTKDALIYGNQYLKDFATGPNASTVGFLMGAVSLNMGDYPTAESTFTRILREQPNNTYREEILYMLGNCQFAQSKFADASKTFKEYVDDFPQGKNIEDVEYHLAVGPLFQGKPDDALGPLQEFLKKYPRGAYAPDAMYRVGVCLSAQQKYDDVFALCKTWQQQFAGNAELGEVLALQGDAFAATGKDDEAIDSYTRAFKITKNPDTQKYALFDGAAKLMQKKGEWDQVSTLFEDFSKENPESPYVINAYFQIGRARIHEGKADEAKTFLAQAVKPYMDDPSRDDVEKILKLLVDLCAKKTRPPLEAPEASPGEAAAASPTPPPDPGLELDRLLGVGGGRPGPTARARILFAKASLAGALKQPAEQGLQFERIADQFKPAVLSAVILAQTADYLVQSGKLDKAAIFYNQLEEAYPKSEEIDSARVGLGEIAYENKDYPAALRQFSDALEKSQTTAKLKDATLGKGETLLAMDKLDEAKKLFEQVASVREWRGPATAQSVFSLGEIAAKQGKLPEAIAYYQRVYVAYQRYLPWVAKAYLNSGEIFEKLGKNQEAINTYNEMIHNEKLSTFPETEAARQRLQVLGTSQANKG